MNPTSFPWRAAALACIPMGMALGAASAAAHHVVWPIQPYYEFIHAVSMRDANAATAQFADDAVVIDGERCTVQSPCRGREAIRDRYVVPLIAARRGGPLVDQRFDGHVLRAREPGQHGGELAFHLGHAGIEAVVRRSTMGENHKHQVVRATLQELR